MHNKKTYKGKKTIGEITRLSSLPEATRNDH